MQQPASVIGHDRKPHLNLLILAIALNIISGGCMGQLPTEPFDITWTNDPAVSNRLISLHAGTSNNYPVKAWYVEIDATAHTHVIVASDSSLLTPSQMAEQTGACVVINGGQFRTDYEPPRHVGLLKSRGKLLEQAIPSIIWDDLRYYVARGAFGLDDDNLPNISWVAGGRKTLQNIEEIPNHRLGQPDKYFGSNTKTEPWPMVEAIGAGPVLVDGGRVRVTSMAEGFWAKGITQPHPRTAIGYTADNRIIMMVVDGRQEGSPGVNLKQLASMMADLGCVRAINLDGGGSTAMIIGGNLINLPAGSTSERPVLSAIGVFCKIHLPPTSTISLN